MILASSSRTMPIPNLESRRLTGDAPARADEGRSIHFRNFSLSPKTLWPMAATTAI